MVVAHGAGAGQASPFMVRTAKGLAERGIAAATFDFPYMAARTAASRTRPPCSSGAGARQSMPRARQFGGLPLFIGGKSMGGRIASQVAAQGCDGIAGLVFLGYPLHPPGKPDQRRDAHLPSIREPMLFVQGTRDAFGTADEIRALLPGCSARRCTKSPAAITRSRCPAAARRSRMPCWTRYPGRRARVDQARHS